MILKYRQEIIIKPAEKGSAVVIDRDHFVLETERQLEDSTYYSLLDQHPTTPEFAKQVSEGIS